MMSRTAVQRMVGVELDVGGIIRAFLIEIALRTDMPASVEPQQLPLTSHYVCLFAAPSIY